MLNEENTPFYSIPGSLPSKTIETMASSNLCANPIILLFLGFVVTSCK